MRKAVFAVAAILGCALWVNGAAAEQLYPKDDLIAHDREKPAGGDGVLEGRFAFTRKDAPAEYVIKEIGWMTLKPGASIGMHKHDINEDTYIIVSGEGVFTDSAGKETKVKEGDVTIARLGDQHALKNTGKEPLVFLDIIAQR